MVLTGETGDQILSDVCRALAGRDVEGAREILLTRYPHRPLAAAKRKYSYKERMAVFYRDGFIDRYSGNRLVFPGTLKLLSTQFSAEFPYHRNWKADACHFAFYELCPTIDHLDPVTRGGPNEDMNWITTSMKLNAAKANFTTKELGWQLHQPGTISDWDGLTGWFLGYVRAEPSSLSDNYVKQWYGAAAAYFPT